MRAVPSASSWLYLAILSGSCLGGSGCWSFGNVSTAASFGQLVGRRAEAAIGLPTFCEATNIFAGPVPSCHLDKVQKATLEVLHYSQSLAKYATMLRDVADFDDPRPRNELLALQLSLARSGELPPIAAPSDGGEIAAAASAVVNKLSQPWRRRKLEELVQSSQPHVVALIDQLLARVTLLGESMRDLADGGLDRRGQLLADLDFEPPARQTAPSPTAAVPLVPPPVPGGALAAAGRLQRQVDRLTLLQFRLLAQRSYDSLIAYQKSLLAFKRAHTILYEVSTTHTTGLSDSSELSEALQRDLPPILR